MRPSPGERTIADRDTTRSTGCMSFSECRDGQVEREAGPHARNLDSPSPSRQSSKDQSGMAPPRSKPQFHAIAERDGSGHDVLDLVGLRMNVARHVARLNRDGCVASVNGKPRVHLGVWRRRDIAVLHRPEVQISRRSAKPSARAYTAYRASEDTTSPPRMQP